MRDSEPKPKRKYALAPALAALALALAGCASLPDRSPAAIAETPAHFAAAKTFAAPAGAWPSDSWWTAYRDPQLTALIEEGLKASPTLAQAQARMRAAQAGADLARGAAGPALDLNLGAQEQKQSYNSGIPAPFVPHGYQDYGRASLDLSYTFDFWGRNRAAIAAAVSAAKASEAEAAEARLTLSTAIAGAYADLARLYAERAIAQKTLDVRTQNAALALRRFKSGLDNKGEQRQAEAGPPAARAMIASLDEQIAQTRNRLAALIGAGPDRGLTIAPPPDVTTAAFGLPSDLALNLIGRRPDVVAARWRAEASSQRVKEAEAQFYPNVNLAAFIGAQALRLENLTAAGSDIGSVGVAASLPIFHAGALRANVRRTDAERDAAIAAYNGALTEALRDMADVAASERALTTRITETQAALAADEDAYAVARQRFEGGLSNYQTVLIAEDAVLAQRLALADLNSRKFTLDIALVRALGGGFTAS
jgi:NodT family efflux transporter outer membrane factor (OMF) lipoprotein